ncbi:MAG: serine hydrolase [Elusimicrobia bacterium]|nr:serine hydrolase [Elusimicrobiota bacterium]
MTKILPVLLALALPAGAAQPCGDLAAAARGVSARISEKPKDLPALFDKTLFAHISEAALADVLAGVRKANGPVTAQALVSSGPACSANFLLDTAQGWRVPVGISMNPVSGKLNGIFFGQAYKKDMTLARVREELAALPGRKGLLVMRFGEKAEAAESLDPEARFAVGSAFKLYVLGALLEEGVPWTRVFRLKEEDKSLPSGKLRGWPDGSPLTAHTLAALMISESDNTASDTLISALGRRRVEAALSALGHSSPEALRPFLRTSEMFRLKADSETALEYINLPTEEKYAFLARLGSRPLTAAALRPGPFAIDKIEWAASPADLCRVMKYFKDKDDKAALEILAMNPGLTMPPGKFLYAGYKGGSEPGVLAMAWLLKNSDGNWSCLAATWNNELAVLEEGKFFSIMQGALNALGGPPMLSEL